MSHNRFRTTDSLIARIKEDFHSFSNAHLIDEGRFYKDITYVLNLLGVKWYRLAEEILTIKDYKADMPIDFRMLEAAYKCTSSVMTREDLPGVVLKKLTFDHYPDVQIPDPHVYDCADTYWDKPKECIFNRQEEILVQRGDCIYKYDTPVLMRPGNVSTKNCLSATCSNAKSNSSSSFLIQNDKFYVNFPEGTVYLQYHALPIDDQSGLPLIPDDEIVEKCIEDYIKYNIIKRLRTNGNADVAQLIPLYDKDYKESLSNAITRTKTPSFQSMIRQIRINRRSLDIYQIN